MTKEECLQIMRLLSALEAIGLMRGGQVPDYLLDSIGEVVAMLEREILK
jgi:hypothetical protein